MECGRAEGYSMGYRCDGRDSVGGGAFPGGSGGGGGGSGPGGTLGPGVGDRRCRHRCRQALAVVAAEVTPEGPCVLGFASAAVIAGVACVAAGTLLARRPYVLATTKNKCVSSPFELCFGGPSAHTARICRKSI